MSRKACFAAAAALVLALTLACAVCASCAKGADSEQDPGEAQTVEATYPAEYRGGCFAAKLSDEASDGAEDGGGVGRGAAIIADVAAIVLSIGVLVLVGFAVSHVAKRYKGTNRRFKR